MLEQIEQILRADGLIPDGWSEIIDDRARDVQQYRDYYDGEHDVHLSDEMKDMLRSDAGFSGNYCELIVNAMTDRLLVRSVSSSESEPGQESTPDAWWGGVQTRSEFDALQLDVHEASVRDGETFVLAEYETGDSASGVTLYHEEAYDGVEGMIAVYGRKRKTITAAVKVWFEVERFRVNIYYPDRVDKYQSAIVGTVEGDEMRPETDEATALEQIDSVPWAAGRVPVVHFKHRASRRMTTGISELKPALPLQDVFNRVLTSMAMIGELTAFPIRVAIGFQPPAKLQPGTWVTVPADGTAVPDDAKVEAYVMEAGSVVPSIEQANFIIEQMATITRTPLPKLMGSGESGEALRERKEGMTGKVQRAQTRLGNAWEDVVRLAQVLQNTFGTESVGEDVSWSVHWKDAQVRDEGQVRENAKQLHEWGYEREALRMMGYDEAEIQKLMSERQADQAGALAALGGDMPGFDQFGGDLLAG